jgi:hypothetical protein
VSDEDERIMGDVRAKLASEETPQTSDVAGTKKISEAGV